MEPEAGDRQTKGLVRQPPVSASSYLPPASSREEWCPPPPPAVCPLCHGAGFVRQDLPVGHPHFGRPVPCQCTRAWLTRKHQETLWRMSNLDAVEDMTFAAFNAKLPGTTEAWSVARAYAADLNGWLVLSSSCGSGKTHLAAAIAIAQFQQGTRVCFTVVPQLLDRLRAGFAPGSEAPYDALFTLLCEVELLVLDDLGTEHATPWVQEKLYQLINHRSLYRLPLVVTTNCDMHSAWDERLRSRLNDVRLVCHLHLTADDYRRRPVMQWHEEAG